MPVMDSLSIVESKTEGSPTAIYRRPDGREFYLHSRYDPLEEARFLVRDIPCRERALYVVLGFGLGYHVKELVRRIPRNSHVLVVEPDSACLSARLLNQGTDPTTAWMQDSRLHCLARRDPMVIPIYLADHQVRLRLLSIEMITHLPSTVTADSFYHTLLSEIPRKFPASFSSHMNSLDQMLENDLWNFWANLRQSWNAVPVGSLQHKWAGRPLIIVSPGPSLTNALSTLRERRGKALLLATAPAARILISERIPPDLVVSVDPYDANLKHFQGWDTSDAPLVYYHRVNRRVLASHVGPKFFFVMQDDPPLPLGRFGEKSPFWRGGSVAFSALQLAHYLEANPIIFVGQDFAFVNGHTHAIGCIGDLSFDAGNLPKDYFFVPGIGGNPVVTNRTYHSYMLFMQSYLLEFSRQKPDVRHINTSTVGARIQGMDHVALQDALAAQASPSDSARNFIDAARSGHQPVAVERQKATLNAWAAELGRLLHRRDQFEDFDREFARFKATSLYAQAARSYDDIYYLYEVRYRNKDKLTRMAFLARFKAHMQFVFDEVLQRGTAV
jgi:hypothetical protein